MTDQDVRIECLKMVQARMPEATIEALLKEAERLYTWVVRSTSGSSVG